jgi:hypothetical protein
MIVKEVLPALDAISNELKDKAHLSLAQHRLDRAHDSELAANLQPIAKQFRHFADEIPYSFELVDTDVARGYDPTTEFLYGLDLILDGLERLLSRSDAAEHS